MAIYNLTLDQLVERTCKLYLRDWIGGTSTSSGSSTTVVDSNRKEQDDFFNNKGSYVYIRSGTYAGTYSKITDFANTTGTITFSPAAGGTIATSVTYSIHSLFPRDEVVAAINQAIDMVAEEALFFKVDETITLADATYEYNLPANFMTVHKVTMADASGTFTDLPFDSAAWLIVPSVPAKLKFLTTMPEGWAGSELAQLITGRKLRVEGLAAPAVLSADADTCPISPAFICAQAASLLHGSRIARAENDPDDHRIQQQFQQAMADRERKNIVSMRLPMNTKRVRE